MVALNKTHLKTLTPDRSAKDSGHRYYSPAASRWLNRDPIGPKGGPNPYGFVRNGPISNLDANGLITGTIEYDQTGWGPYSEGSASGVGGIRGWHFRARWTPHPFWGDGSAELGSTQCSPCQQLIWVQTYTRLNCVNTVTSYEPWVTDWDETDYSGNSDLWVNGARPRGHNLDVAETWDDPNAFWPGLPALTRHFFCARTCAKCIAGDDAGEVYGCIGWGFRYDKGFTPDLIGIGPLIFDDAADSPCGSTFCPLPAEGTALGPALVPELSNLCGQYGFVD